MSEYLSYAQFVKDRNNFRKAGTNTGSFLNVLDSPSHKYFKILFYFSGSAKTNLSVDAYGLTSGLLAPTWENFAGTNNTDYYNYNSAWAYLKMNDENERADKLEQFVTLLSNISTYSPWYFNSISGIQEALERKPTEDGKFELGEAKKLSITCLPDAFDNRLTTLLELYRTVTWSWIHKKEILPANLRKFDMAVYIFESPVDGWHKDAENDYDSLDGSGTIPSYKMIEFHDCEFNYNSIKSGFNELNNQEGFAPTYTIDITYKDCYDISYNSLLVNTIGDVIKTDIYQAIMDDSDDVSNTLDVENSLANINNKVTQQSTKSSINNTINSVNNNLLQDAGIKNNKYYYATPGNLENTNPFGISKKRYKVNYEPDFIGNAIGQIAGHFVEDIKDKFKRAVLGNIHTYSLTDFAVEAKNLMEGNIISAGMTVADYIKNGQKLAAMKLQQKPSGNIYPKVMITDNSKPSGNIYPDASVDNTTKQKPSGDLFPEPVKPSQMPLGNIFN